MFGDETLYYLSEHDTQPAPVNSMIFCIFYIFQKVERLRSRCACPNVCFCQRQNYGSKHRQKSSSTWTCLWENARLAFKLRICISSRQQTNKCDFTWNESRVRTIIRLSRRLPCGFRQLSRRSFGVPRETTRGCWPSLSAFECVEAVANSVRKSSCGRAGAFCRRKKVWPSEASKQSAIGVGFVLLSFGRFPQSEWKNIEKDLPYSIAQKNTNKPCNDPQLAPADASRRWMRLRVMTFFRYFFFAGNCWYESKWTTRKRTTKKNVEKAGGRGNQEQWSVSGANPGRQRNSGSSRDWTWLIGCWLNATVRGLHCWNYHLLSVWLALSLLRDVSYVTMNKKLSWELVYCYSA